MLEYEELKQAVDAKYKIVCRDGSNRHKPAQKVCKIVYI